jgi:hypothetical protein
VLVEELFPAPAELLPFPPHPETSTASAQADHANIAPVDTFMFLPIFMLIS